MPCDAGKLAFGATTGKLNLVGGQPGLGDMLRDGDVRGVCGIWGLCEQVGGVCEGGIK